MPDSLDEIEICEDCDRALPHCLCCPCVRCDPPEPDDLTEDDVCHDYYDGN